MSKLFLNALCRIYAAKAREEKNGVMVNACCPGFCDTNMTSSVPVEKPKNAKDGAYNVLTLALIPMGSTRPNGTFLLDI